jgi:hypothetical protein
MQDNAVVEKLFLTLHVRSFLGSARPMMGEGATLFGHRIRGGRGLSIPGALSLSLFSRSFCVESFAAGCVICMPSFFTPFVHFLLPVVKSSLFGPGRGHEILGRVCGGCIHTMA